MVVFPTSIQSSKLTLEKPGLNQTFHVRRLLIAAGTARYISIPVGASPKSRERTVMCALVGQNWSLSQRQKVVGSTPSRLASPGRERPFSFQ